MMNHYIHKVYIFFYEVIKFILRTLSPSLYRKLQYRKSKLPLIRAPKMHNEGKYSVTHISAFNYGNAGDVVLPIVLRQLFEDTIGVREWHNAHVYHKVDVVDVWLMNKDDCVIIGGGGLFLKDTNPNDLSGWQWSCSIQKLRKIRKPIIMFAVGYNRFRGQEDFSPRFSEHINMFVKQAVFVGLRNHGSIESLKRYLKSNDLKEKLCFQPCMTTLISRIYPDIVNYNIKEDFIAINCAFDREEMRASGIVNQYESIARIAKRLSAFTKIKIYVHVETDKLILSYIDRMSVEYELVEFHDVESVIKEYSKPRIVIGMRGHSQMIPFGCHTPILSIISHDKMKWFLDDIHHPNWGVDFGDSDFENKLFEKAVSIYNNYLDIMSEIEKEQVLLWDITMHNMRQIKKILSTTCIR